MKIRIILLIFIGLCLSCSEGDRLYENLKVVIGYDEEPLVNGQNIEVDSFRIVPLETTSGSVLSRIDRLLVSDSLIFIHDNDRLLCFDYSGKFLYPIGVKGRGAGEYLRISTIFINPFLHTINIVDEVLDKVLTYRLDGTYLYMKKYPSRSFYMAHTAYLADNDKLLCNNYIYNNFNQTYSMINIETGISQFLCRSSLHTKNTAMPTGQETVAFNNDTIKMLLPFDNKLYTCTDSSLIPIISIRMDKKILSEKRLNAETDFSIMTYFNFSEEGYFAGFKSICETRDYILLNEAGENQYFLVDKRKNAGRRYFYNDAGEQKYLPLLGICTTDGDYLVGTVPNFVLKNFVKQIPESVSGQELNKLREVGFAIQEEDNPCIFFYKLRS
ncbi:MAG: 6-bladed beta-propeller [Odoribacter splanchnicus]